MCPADVTDTSASTARAPGRPREAATEDAIIDAALGLLDEQCYSQITIEKIASRAGVSKPTIYRRWKTKAEVMLHAYSVRSSNLRGPPVLPTDDAFSDLENFLVRLVTVTSHPTNARAARCFIAESQYDEVFRVAFQDVFVARRLEALRKCIEHGQNLGQMRRDINVVVVCDLIYGAFTSRLIGGTLPLDKQFAADLVATLRPCLAEPMSGLR